MNIKERGGRERGGREGGSEQVSLTLAFPKRCVVSGGTSLSGHLYQDTPESRVNTSINRTRLHLSQISTKQPLNRGHLTIQDTLI